MARSKDTFQRIQTVRSNPTRPAQKGVVTDVVVFWVFTFQPVFYYTLVKYLICSAVLRPRLPTAVQVGNIFDSTRLQDPSCCCCRSWSTGTLWASGGGAPGEAELPEPHQPGAWAHLQRDWRRRMRATHRRLWEKNVEKVQVIQKYSESSKNSKRVLRVVGSSDSF